MMVVDMGKDNKREMESKKKKRKKIQRIKR
jgi:hypothetical protein